MNDSLNLSWDNEYKIIRQYPQGISTLDKAEKVIKAVFDMLERHPGAGMLVDGLAAPAMTKHAGELFRSYFLDPRITKIAYLNTGPAIAFDIDYLTSSFPNPEMLLEKFNIFQEEAEAIKWLKA